MKPNNPNLRAGHVGRAGDGRGSLPAEALEEYRPGDPRVVDPVADPVHRPAHYNLGRIEVIEFIEDQGLNFARGSVIKYTARAGKKDGAPEAQDLEKAIWYLRRELELVRARDAGRDPERPNDMVKLP